MSKFNRDKKYEDLLMKMEKEFQNSEVIQCFIKTEINKALLGDSMSYEDLKTLASVNKKEISERKKK